MAPDFAYSACGGVLNVISLLHGAVPGMSAVPAGSHAAVAAANLTEHGVACHVKRMSIPSNNGAAPTINK